MKFYIDQHGCAKNQVDGEELVARLEAEGHEYVGEGAQADLIIALGIFVALKDNLERVGFERCHRMLVMNLKCHDELILAYCIS